MTKDNTAPVVEAEDDQKLDSTETKEGEEPKKTSLIETASNEEADDVDDEEYEHEAMFEHVNKVPFVAMCDILHALSAAFMPGKDDEPNGRFMAAWTCALALGCWSEEDFWSAYDLDEPCPICGGDMSDFDDEDEELPELPAAKEPKKHLPN